ncbi:MAG: aminoacyl-tRNA hydrolase, partial [Actinomycetota bacterium]|nr:aminoacyl-tRNA hydrolase [Actinomycetota bacterium]
MSELEMRFSTSGGPGGQHANKVATRVDVSWNVERSGALGPRQRARVKENLGRRIDSSGCLHVSSDRFRSQMRNRQDALERLARLVGEALTPRKERVGTGPTKASKERRLSQKKRRSEVKRARKVTG